MFLRPALQLPGRPRLVADAPATSRRGFLAACACACALPAVLSSGAKAQMPPPSSIAPAPARPLHAALDESARAIEGRMIAWRRDIHQNPELGNQEVRTSAMVAAHLRTLGYTVRDKVAVTGLVATLKGEGGPGPTLALRADMDALPVPEEVDLPFASRAKTMWGGQEVGVMHACGHDCHTAILMATAEVLARHRADLRGTVVLVFQPAEENLPDGEIGGARRMLDEGAFNDPKPDAVFGLHVVSGLTAGTLGYRPGPAAASADEFTITVHGRQTHGARPWGGVDPIVIGAQIISALQTIQSRQVDSGASPSVLTVGQFHGGNRSNIIPDRATMNGTLRTYDEERRQFIMRRVKEVSESIAQGMDGRAEVSWLPNGYPSMANDPALTQRMAPSLARVAGEGALRMMPPGLAAEDFAYFSRTVPGVFFNVGVTAPGLDPRQVPTNHSPRFRVDESGLLPGLRAMLHMVADYTGSGVA
ncbi:amidohydrolase [Roseomonas sp. KE2513]|uniref:amidohydrolase n=1 Tax=Roseomonas sp. KE2513 TaxID=2479202 RepID=UPI0018E0247D|nr:amidohydrolase [Roseomonas sp. KE2513]MBI0534234.1 amidohydrolase [Roseomonas sp. KE2513]